MDVLHQVLPIPLWACALGLLLVVVLLALYLKALLTSKLALNRSDDAYQQLQQLEQEAQTLQQDLQDLSEEKLQLAQRLAATYTELNLVRRQQDQEEQIEARRQEALMQQFKYVSEQMFQQQSQSLVTQNKHSLDTVMQPFRERLESFQNRINQIHHQSVQDNTVLQSQIQQVMQMGLSMSQEAQHLSQALKGNKKILGNWGEMQLELAMQQAGLQKDRHYFTQRSFTTPSGQRLIPDAVIALPDHKHLVVDSKVSLNDYQQATSCSEAEQSHYLQRHLKAVKHHIDDLSAKNYSNLPGLNSPGFVFMFMPIESAYIQTLKTDETIFQYAYSKNIVLASPSTLIPMLKTIGFLWMMENSNQQVLQLGHKAADLYNQVVTVAEYLEKLGGSFNTTAKQFNQIVRAFSGQRGLINKVASFKELSAKAVKQMPELHESEAYFKVEPTSAKPANYSKAPQNTPEGQVTQVE